VPTCASVAFCTIVSIVTSSVVIVLYLVSWVLELPEGSTVAGNMSTLVRLRPRLQLLPGAGDEAPGCSC
jgi:hypothetical protein